MDQNFRHFKILAAAIPLTLLMMSFSKIHGKVVCFGDSITHGAQVDGHSWVWILSKEHKDVDFVNAGRNGRKTSDKAELLPVLKQNPDASCYIIFLGVNDLKDGTEAMVDSCLTNMKWMLARIRETDPGAHIVILAPSDINLKTMNQINRDKKYNEHTKASLYSLENRYKALASKEHIGFISLLHVVSPANYADGLHPTIQGQTEIAGAVWKGLSHLSKKW